MEITQNSIDNILRCLEEIKSEVQFLSVKPKETHPAEDHSRDCIPYTLATANPCDTLTRQHAEFIENEKKVNPRQEILDVEDIKRYCSPLIPGCPNDVKKENP